MLISLPRVAVRRPGRLETPLIDDRWSLIIFARVPRAGHVKTRLAATIGDAAALSAYVSLADRVIGAAARSSMYSITVAFTPATGEDAMREWLGPSLARTPQTEGDLGARMSAAIDAAIRAGAQRVVVIGTDCPDLTAPIIEDAFERLAAADVVLGPASDGGYYLIGMSRLHAGLFEDVPWSSPATLHVTLGHAQRLGLSVALLDERRDVDTAADWNAWLASSQAAPGGQ